MKIPFVETVDDSRIIGLHPVSGQRAVAARPPWDPDSVRIYCISCHHPAGYISSDIPGIIALCDAFNACGCNCVETKGELTLPRLAI